MSADIRTRRVHEDPSPDDGARVLVDNRIRGLAARGPVTLLTATKDLSISQAAVLADLLGHE